MIQRFHFKSVRPAILDAKNAQEVQLLVVLVKLAIIYMNRIVSQLARMATTQKPIQENAFYAMKPV